MSYCPHCNAGHIVSFGRHVRISERGIQDLGPCLLTDDERAELFDSSPPVVIGAAIKSCLMRIRTLAEANWDKNKHWSELTNDKEGT